MTLPEMINRLNELQTILKEEGFDPNEVHIITTDDGQEILTIPELLYLDYLEEEFDENYLAEAQPPFERWPADRVVVVIGE